MSSNYYGLHDTNEQFKQELRKAIRDANGQWQLSIDWDIPQPIISDALTGRRPAERVLAKLGWERVTFYRRKKEGQTDGS